MADQPKMPPVFTREAVLKLVPQHDGEPEHVEMAISSEHGVERMDFWTGERFIEVLDHSDDAIDWSYARDGLPILLDHASREHVGILEGVRLDADKHIRGTPKYSRSQRGREVEQDVKDGIRKKISVGYHVAEWDKQKPEKRGALPVWRAMKWMPIEASHVAIPADPSVGVGRSAEVAAPAVHTHQTARKAEERTVSDESTAATPQAVQYRNDATGTTGRTEWVETPEQKSNREAVEAAKRNGAEMKEVATLAEMHALESVLIAGTKAGKGASDIRADMVSAMRERMGKGVPSVNNPIVELTPKEQKQYNYSRGIEAMLNGKDSFETDISQEIIRQTGVTARSEFSFFVPTSTRAGLYNAATVGAEVVFDAPGSFIDMLRNKARVLQLGATYLGGIREPLTFPEQTTAGTATWVAENSGSDVSDSNAVFTTKTLTPKTLMSSTSFSRQLLRQAHTNFDIDNIVRADLAAIHGLAIDLACLTGGASNSPQGIFSNTNVSVYLIATNGAAPTYTDMVAHEYTVELNNGNVSSMGFLTTPAIKGTLKTTQKFASTNGEPVWQGGEVGEVAGYKAFSSNQVNKNITAGTSTTLAHAIYFGCWDQLYIGEWGAMETIVDPYRLKKQGMIEVTTFQMIGLMVRRPKAFVYSKSALAAAAFA